MYYLRINGANFPVAPENFTEELANKDETITLISQDEVTVPKKPGLEAYTLSIRLPAEDYPWACWTQPKGSKIDEGFNEPGVYKDFLKNLKEKKKSFELVLVSDMDEDGSVDAFAKDVTLESVSFTADANEGDDVIAECTFREWVDYSTAVKKNSGKKKTSKSKKEPKKKSYTVAKGDTLKKISKKMYGVQKYASKIYSWNKKAIEKAAKDHKRKSSDKGKYIYKGTKLKLKTIKVTK